VDHTELPAAIVAACAALAQPLTAWSRTHPDQSLAVHEQGVLDILRAQAPALLEAVLQVATQDLHPAITTVARRCPRCDGRLLVHEQRARMVQTVCGALTVARPWYHCRACRQGFSPADSTLGITPRARLSVGLQAWVVRLGATLPFAEAATLLEDLTGLALATDTVWTHTGAAGRALRVAEQAAVTHVQATREPDPTRPLDPVPGLAVIQVDGVMVRYTDGWHEVKVGLVGGERDGQVVATSYVAARADPGHFGPLLVAEAARRGVLEVIDWQGALTGPALARLPLVHLLGDGAAWIWNLGEDHFGHRVDTLDYYHACEHLWTAARALFGQASAPAAAWAQEQCATLLTRGPRPVQVALAQAQRRTRPTGEARATVVRERAYLRTHATRMDYPTLRLLGMVIGSGAIESSAKHLVQIRMKRPGQRWSEAGADAVLALRARLVSQRRSRTAA
jgi:hypothetical protein